MIIIHVANKTKLIVNEYHYIKIQLDRLSLLLSFIRNNIIKWYSLSTSFVLFNTLGVWVGGFVSLSQALSESFLKVPAKPSHSLLHGQKSI